MYFFSRTARVRSGKLAEATQWAVELTGRVNRIADLRLQLWTSMLSPGLGTIAWSAFVPDLVTLDTANSKLAADAGFMAETANSQELIADGSFDDMVLQVVHTEGQPVAEPHYAGVVTTAMAAGGLARGVELGIEIARRGTELGGVATSFLVASTGPYGGCAWISATETLEDLERGEQAVNMNPDFVAFLDREAAGVYRPEVSQQVMWRRIS